MFPEASLLIFLRRVVEGMTITVIAVLCLVVDQLSKYLIADYFANAAVQSVPIIENVLYFTYTENEGAAFGMLDGARWLFIVVTVAACVLLIFWLVRQRGRLHWLLKVSSGLILSGAVGNLIDRIVLGYVRDFIHVNIHFAIFNFADCCVVVGVILFGIYLLFIHEKYQALHKTEPQQIGDDHNASQ